MNLLRIRNLYTLLVLAALLISSPVFGQKGVTLRTDALVLVNSASISYPDFQHYIQPYLDNFGMPYTLLDIATASVNKDIGEYSVIIIGHKQLDLDDKYLDTREEANISAAIRAGTGLVNFDNDLSVASKIPRYQFVEDIFGFGYILSPIGSGVRIGASEDPAGEPGILIKLREDDHQNPELETTENTNNLLKTGRQYSAVSGQSHYEEGLDQPVVNFYANQVPNGEYKVFANLYSHDIGGRGMRYYYGYTSNTPKIYFVDTLGGAGGKDNYEEVRLSDINITDNTFRIYMPGTAIRSDFNPPFGWVWIRLVPVGRPLQPELKKHYIIALHEAGDEIITGSMRLAGIILPEHVMALAMTDSQPFLAVTTFGHGRAVQWGTYDWISKSVKGQLYGLDDLVWRSIVWAARKPFVMQGLPPFVTMRVDDSAGPFDWIHIANDFKIKPWIGFTIDEIDEAEATNLSGLIHFGQATASIHAFDAHQRYFYWPSYGSARRSRLRPGSIQWIRSYWRSLITKFFHNPVIIKGNFTEGTTWLKKHNIPTSKFVVPHKYRLDPAAFQGLSDWGVEFVGTVIEIGTKYSNSRTPLAGRPYSLFEQRSGNRSARPIFYADFITVPGYPEFEKQFFNCITEIRDDTGYEWYPGNDVAGSIARGTRQTKRALDSMVLATLFTHEGFITALTAENWRAILDGITKNIVSYNPIYVTMDYACQYIRALYTSNIVASAYDPELGRVSTTLNGHTDMPTMFYLFIEENDSIRHTLIDVPLFSGPIKVVSPLDNPKPTLPTLEGNKSSIQ